MPKLVVLVIVDQWPEWSFEQKRPVFTEGFARLLREGEWHVGHHPSAATLTAPGHALIGTGEPSFHSGILANEWWHRDLGVALKSVEAADGTMTADWLRVNGIGDSIAAAKTGAKAVSISLKDRAAILPLGHAGLAIWWDPKKQSFQTFATPPAWLAAATQSALAKHEAVWTPLDPKRLAQLSGTTDDQKGETGEKGFGATFPHDPSTVQKPDEAFYATPTGNEIVFDAARAAIAGEQLGTDKTSDVLILSLSAHDYIGHGWGHESWEQWDAELRLDQQLGAFLGDLDKTVGAGQWAMIVTSDHGASPMPERMNGGRITFLQIQKAANHAASAVLGPGQWIDNAHYPNIYFSKAMLAQPKGELASATQRVLYAIKAFPGIERVGKVSDYAGNCDKRTGVEATLCISFDPERSGDLFYMPARGWIMQDDDEPTATAHGSWQDYDQRVPLILVPPDRTAHGPATGPKSEIEMTRIAQLLSTWLGVKDPRSLPARPQAQVQEDLGSGSGSAGHAP
ncbi:MAG TPA: alkaline phosphatase family protein [Kofleriaceae bacterium]